MKTNLISLRVTDEELKIITENADKMNLSKSEYLRKLAVSGDNDLKWKRDYINLISRMCNTINAVSSVLNKDNPELAESLQRGGVELWLFLK